MNRLSRTFIPFGVLALLVMIPLSGLDAGTIIYIQCAASLGVYLWIVFSWRSATGLVMDAYILFATAVFLFNAGQTVLYGIGALNSLLDGKFSDTTLIDTLTMVNCYLVAMHLGASMVATTRLKRRASPFTPSVKAGGRMCATRVGWIFLAISFPFALVQLSQALTSVYAQGSFTAMYQGNGVVGADAAPMILGQFVIPGALFLLAGAPRHSLHRWIALSLISAYVLIQFFLGFRGFAIVVTAGTAWLWNKTIQKLPVGLVLIAVIPLVILLPLIAKTRNTPGPDRLRADFLQDAYAQLDNPAFDLINEMGGSMSVNADILELVPQIRPFDRGISYVYAASALVPNFFWPGVHPAALNSPSKWLIEQVDPVMAELGGGRGFTVFAEAYLNFGLLGGGIVIALIGAALATVSVWTGRVSDPGRNAFFAVALCFLLLYSRAEFGDVVRGLVWYAGLPYLLYRFMFVPTQRDETPSTASRIRTRGPQPSIPAGDLQH
jgi:oligosaccharide repeat unit polymerase